MRYYHCTRTENIEKILKEGLRPGAERGYCTSYNGKQCDSNYVYLVKNFEVFKEDLFNGLLKQPEVGLLSVDLPSEHPVERDLDVHMLITTQGLFASAELFRFMSLLCVKKLDGCEEVMDKDKRTTLDLLIRKENNGDKIAKGLVIQCIAEDVNAVKFLLSKATPKKWDEALGFYRTAKAIPPNGNYKIKRYSLAL